MNRVLALLVFVELSCTQPHAAKPSPQSAPLSYAADLSMLTVPGGSYRLGSTQAERERAYNDYLETHGDDSARRNSWFEREVEAHRANEVGFRLDKTPVTQAAYAEFVRAGGAPAPTMNATRWRKQGFSQPFESEVARYNWHADAPPKGRERHPVVLVEWRHAAAYCAWRGTLVASERWLPSATQFEKAARGPNDDIYPWGDSFDPTRLNNGYSAPRDTMPVQSFPNGRSPIGAFDMAGNVFQWTRTAWPSGRNRMTVKGSAWDDFGGLGRAAAAHGRPASAAHVIVGFRCAGPLD